jgi:phosphatidylglycerol---prolipoprotein diacylglyceryl transferase
MLTPHPQLMWHSLSGPAAHIILEIAAYFIGANVFWRLARNEPQPPFADRLLLLGGAVFGALIGSKLLHMMEHLPYLLARNELPLWIGGKSVLGGFLGGTLGVELVKKSIGWTTPTGDPWVPAITVGLIVGRLGCQLSGTWDQTYGAPTTLPWAWDYGDGVGRHPTALYEMMLVTLAFGATRMAKLHQHRGAPFAVFLFFYCAIRFGIEWLKPPFGNAAAGSLPVALYANLTAIQWTALFGMAWYLSLLRIRLRSPSRH